MVFGPKSRIADRIILPDGPGSRPNGRKALNVAQGRVLGNMGVVVPQEAALKAGSIGKERRRQNSRRKGGMNQEGFFWNQSPNDVPTARAARTSSPSKSTRRKEPTASA